MASRFGKFFGNTASEGAAFAIGRATAPTLTPVLQDIANAAWSLHPDMPVDAYVLAEGVAQGQVPRDWAEDEAKRTGFNGERFGHLVDIASVGPGVSAAFDLWRRNVIGEPAFRRALKRIGLEPEWIDDLVKLKTTLLTPGELAAAIHRGLVPDPGLLQGEQPAPPFNVDAYPVYQIPPLDEAAGQGFDRDRLGVLVGLQGLPMGPHEAAQALFRGIITHGDYIRAFNESNSRNEWAQAVLDQSRQIPTARDFFENALRGYHDFDWALNEAKRHGMSEADATVIYQNQGRPMNVRQITQALARGGRFHPEPGEITDPYRASIVEGNLKPAYYELADSLKYTYPSAFAIKTLAEAGTLGGTNAVEQILLEMGWKPDLAAKVAASWTAGRTTTDPHVTKAQVQLWATLHSSYLAGDATPTLVRAKLPHAGVAAGAIEQVLTTWNHERDVVRQRLTAAQVKRAFRGTVQNRATGAPWTRDDALIELLSRGWSRDDANTYLDE